MRRLALPCLLLALLAQPAFAQPDLPAVSAAGARNGEVEPFLGKWSIMKPGGDPTSVTDSCAMPAEIMQNGRAVIRYYAATGASFDFTLSAEAGRTAWAGSPARLAVWQDEDTFYLYPRLADGSPDTSGAQLFQRCPVWPQKSYAGAVAGALEPFVGSWQEAVPPARGAGPLQIVGSCEDPTRFAINDEKSLLRTIANEPDRILPIERRGNDTVSPHPMAGYRPSVIVWTGPDRFHFHIIDVYGQTDWNTPIIYSRCPQ